MTLLTFLSNSAHYCCSSTTEGQNRNKKKAIDYIRRNLTDKHLDLRIILVQKLQIIMSIAIGSIKVSNSDRLQKVVKRKRVRFETPRKFSSSDSVMNTCGRYEIKYGYTYMRTESVKLKWIRQEFEEKINKYLGKDGFVKKATRFDKMKRKEELNFQVQLHPVIRRLSYANNLIEKKLKLYALRCLFN